MTAGINQQLLLAANRFRRVWKKHSEQNISLESLCEASKETETVLAEAMLVGGDVADTAETLWDSLFGDRIVVPPKSTAENKPVSSKPKAPPKEEKKSGLFGWLTSEKKNDDDDDDDDDGRYRGGVR